MYNDNVFTHAVLFVAVAVVGAPLLAEHVAVPAFSLGWDAAAFCGHLISNGFSF